MKTLRAIPELVPIKTISLIVHSSTLGDPVLVSSEECETLTGLGQTLADENLDCVLVHDPEVVPGPDYQHPTQGVQDPGPLKILQLLEQLELNSQASPGWVGSRARLIIENLRRHAIRRLPGF